MAGARIGLRRARAGRSTTRCARLGCVLAALAATACTPLQSTLRPPYVLDGVTYSEDQLQSVALERCRAAIAPSNSLPPHGFTTDGCTLSPSGSWGECCIAHDMAYWCGAAGDARQLADQSLSACVVGHGHPLLAKFIYLGVRLGGSRWLPFPWRWGYGYPWPHAGAASGGTPQGDAGGRPPTPESRTPPDADARVR